MNWRLPESATALCAPMNVAALCGADWREQTLSVRRRGPLGADSKHHSGRVCFGAPRAGSALPMKRMKMKAPELG
jgi:hypothetical protein